ncbi:hypothetical protein JTE90_021511 [Oedothorax gibbosus]|uniref:DnaJ homolog subfamily C member 16 n=1 Tax=Oedothorax gibbosus TaxID=931172 RepID=A0AAV6VNQ5_9ARAC|nr:hypothetical protein JTE90_021511 [Oedothorax gibbosus]
MKCLIVIFYILSFTKAVDYYDLLGVSKDSDNREIRKAFKKLALKLHPDKNKGREEAHEQFIAINKAYEVLKDEETRKKYDLYGEEGLKQDFGHSWKGNYHSWNYYYESFGIYDDDPEIITLNKNDFVQSVLETSDYWFVNFYSPQCSHCHHLAPAWRELARKLEGVIQIGAVNCEEDWMLCRQQNIHSYPSLVFYPQKEKYQGHREVSSMIDYVLQQLPYNIIRLTSDVYSEIISMSEFSFNPWLIFTCVDSNGCIESDDLKKLGVILDHLVNTALVDTESDPEICKMVNCFSPASFYHTLSEKISAVKGNFINFTEIEVSALVKAVVEQLPEPEEFTDTSFEAMRDSTQNLNSSPQLMLFTKDMEKSIDSNKIDLKRLKGLLPEVVLGHIDCEKYASTCSSIFIQKFPTFLLFKPGGSYEFHYGRITAYEVARFTREALSSQVQTLTPDHFPKVIESAEAWFIDFFAPWCPPCMQLLPHWRKASQTSGHLVKFGTVDCTVHVSLCRQYKINSYPTAILYNQSVPHKFHGSHSQQQLEEFLEDILNPIVVPLTPTTFESLVQAKSISEIWAIDFFAPWCGPCQQLAPQWRKLAKMLTNQPLVHIGEVDCQKYHSLCTSVGVNSYPTIRLYPTGEGHRKGYYSYNGWNRDSISLQAWIYNFLPSKVKILTNSNYKEALSDNSPWIIDYYAPWCSHCQTFAPEFEKIAQAVEGKVKAGKVNCEEYPRVCGSVRAYPTVIFYESNKGNHNQNPIGIELHTLTFDGIYNFLEEKLNVKFKIAKLRDEL